MARRKRMHGKKRRSPAKFMAGMKHMSDFFKKRNATIDNDLEMTDQGPIAKPTGEDQREYNPKQAELKQKLELDRARIEMSMALDKQKQRYEDHFSKNKGDGSHTHSHKESMNTTESRPLGLSGELHENQYKGLDFSQMQFQTANASPFAKKTGFKMKRKK